MSYSVHVSGLSPETSEEKVKDFFLFCGAITSLKKQGNTADITFQRPSAARTALMLNGGTLDGAHLEVTAPELSESAGLPKDAKGSTPIGAATEDDHLAQEDKPKAGIMAEYLAAGYNISDSVIQQAIEFDHKQGISAKFLEYFNKLDNKIGSTVAHQPEAKATELLQGQVHAVANKAKEIDQQRGFTSFLWDYYSKAINTNTGQKVLHFYTNTQKQVLDVHEEAKRIAQEKKAHGEDPLAGVGSSSTTTGAKDSTSTAGNEKPDSSAGAPASDQPRLGANTSSTPATQ